MWNVQRCFLSIFGNLETPTFLYKIVRFFLVVQIFHIVHFLAVFYFLPFSPFLVSCFLHAFFGSFTAFSTLRLHESMLLFLLLFFPVFVFFVLVPLLELFLQPDHSNFDQETALLEKNSQIYDWILYLAVPVQVGMLIYFFYVIGSTPYDSLEFYGRIFAMGLMCGVMGINIGHELGHRPERINQLLGEILLLTSLNTHFLPYHNEGHHREVATPQDPATAKRGQWLFHFWITSHFGSYFKAWKIEASRMRKRKKPLRGKPNKTVIGYKIGSGECNHGL
mgnify:CR=1 FL=1